MTTIPYEEALATENPVMELRGVIADLLAKGEFSREQIFEALDHARLELRKKGAEHAEDVLAEVLDFMTGWCSPRMKL